MGKPYIQIADKGAAMPNVKEVEIAHRSCESLRFRRDGNLLCVEHAPPVMWFASHVLAGTRPDPDIGLSFDGEIVTLRAANGRWMWKLTGRTRCLKYGPSAIDVVMVEGIWPD